jgi:hypothetical protein
VVFGLVFCAIFDDLGD